MLYCLQIVEVLVHLKNIESPVNRIGYILQGSNMVIMNWRVCSSNWRLLYMNTTDHVHDVCHMKTKVDHESFRDRPFNLCHTM